MELKWCTCTVCAPTLRIFSPRNFARRENFAIATILAARNQSFLKPLYKFDVVNARMLLQMHLYPLTVNVIDRLDYMYLYRAIKSRLKEKKNIEKETRKVLPAKSKLWYRIVMSNNSKNANKILKLSKCHLEKRKK